MDIYASDEEKSEAIKQWWRDNGRSVVTGALLVASAVFAGKYWLNYQQVQTQKAATAYLTVTTAVANNEQEKADSMTQTLLSEFSSTPYSLFAAIEMATNSVKNGDTDTAKTYLQWVIDNAQEQAHIELARYRLATLLFDQDQNEQALVLLEQSTLSGFSSIVNELKGDIFVKQNNDTAANEAYSKAIVALKVGEPRLNLIQMKLDDLTENSNG
jgi:predicted negative regulator of RcsB-dependent stress response